MEAATGNKNGSVPLSSIDMKRKTEKLGQATNSLQFLFKFVVRWVSLIMYFVVVMANLSL